MTQFDIPNSLIRLAALIGNDGIRKLRGARVAVVGLGGVGSWAAEGIARSGIGTIILVDGDRCEHSNMNRQLFSLNSTIGLLKTQAAEKRLLDVAQDIKIEVIPEFLCQLNLALLFDYKPDVVIDAIDRIDDKVALLKGCIEHGLPVVSSMGAGERISANRIMAAPLSQTYGCPLAKKLRRVLNGTEAIQRVTAVFSPTPPIQSASAGEGDAPFLGSAVWVTARFGFALTEQAVAILLA